MMRGFSILGMILMDQMQDVLWMEQCTEIE
nr:MAG TPA: hypothetical protein [Caudoviricetes sp.]